MRLLRIAGFTLSATMLAACTVSSDLAAPHGGSVSPAGSSIDESVLPGWAADLPTSADSWTLVRLEPPTSEAHLVSIVASGPGLIAVGWGGDYVGPPALWISSNGQRWSRLPDGKLGRGYISDVAVAGRRLVAVGRASWEGGGIYKTMLWTSGDGVAWTRAAVPAAMRDGTVDAIVAVHPGVVAVGTFGFGRRARSRAWFTLDGLDWERASVPAARGASMTHVVASDERIVAFGRGGGRVVIWTSLGGRTWTQRALDDGVFPAGSWIGGITDAAGRLVAVGGYRDDPMVWTSDGGGSWRRVPGGQESFDPGLAASPSAGSRSFLSSVAASGGRYLAVGTDGDCRRDLPGCRPSDVVWVSRDGSSWFRAGPGDLFPGGEVNGVTAWGSRFVAYGSSPSDVWISEIPADAP